MRNDTVAYYERNAREFFDSTVSVDMSPQYRAFLARLDPGAHILDAGCGSGRDAKAFADRGFAVTAFDVICDRNGQVVLALCKACGQAEVDLEDECPDAPICPDCNGTKEVFTHADDCTDDLCALNGDMHSCSGKVEPCGACGVRVDEPADLLRRARDTFNALLGDMEGIGSRTQLDDDLLPEVHALAKDLNAANGVALDVPGSGDPERNRFLSWCRSKGLVGRHNLWQAWQAALTHGVRGTDVGKR